MNRQKVLRDRLWMKPGDFDYSGFGFGHYCMSDGSIVWGECHSFLIDKWFDRLRDPDCKEIEDRIAKILSACK